jgi:hypothetical protein
VTQHFPDLPAAGELTATDRLCSSSLPCKGDRAGIERVFHEAGPVAYIESGTAQVRCIHCSREFDSVCPENTDTTLTGAA